MEQLYSIGTTNRYAMLIDDDEDPGDVIVTSVKEPTVTKMTKGESAKETSKTTKVAKGKENKDKSQKQNKAMDNANKMPDRVNSGGQRKSGPRVNGRGEKQTTGDRPDNRQERQSGAEERRGPSRGQGGRPRLASKDNDRENVYSGDDRPPRGGRGPRPFRGGSRGGQGGQRSGKREFERRSGSDKSSIKAVDKREGGGAHNWGKQDEAAVEDWPEDPEAQQDTQEPIANGDVAPENKEKAEGEGETEEAAEQEEDPSAKEMTLDEYKAQHNVETLKADTSLQRNVDNSQWKDTVALKKEDAEFFPGTREIIEKPKTSGRTKTVLDPNFYFKDQARRGRGRTSGPRGGGSFPREDRDRNDRDRNDRGNDRGNDRDRDRGSGETSRRNFDEGGRRDGGRGGNRRGGFGGRGGGQGRFSNYSKKDRAPNMEDESDFPTLGAA